MTIVKLVFSTGYLQRLIHILIRAVFGLNETAIFQPKLLKKLQKLVKKLSFSAKKLYFHKKPVHIIIY